MMKLVTLLTRMMRDIDAVIRPTASLMLMVKLSTS